MRDEFCEECDECPSYMDDCDGDEEYESWRDEASIKLDEWCKELVGYFIKSNNKTWYTNRPEKLLNEVIDNLKRELKLER